MELALYAEMDIVVVMVIALLLLHSLTNADRQAKQILIIRIYACSISLTTLDLFWKVVESGHVVVAREANCVINILYYLISAFLAYCWFCYAEFSLGGRHQYNMRLHALLRIPLYMIFALIISTYWTGYFFYIDLNNCYVRGPYYMPFLILTYAYAGFAVAHAFLRALTSHTYALGLEYGQLARFALFPFVASVLEVVYPNIPFVPAGLMLALLSLHLDTQERKISQDPLTQLNNRNKLIPYIENLIHQEGIVGKLYFFMLDVDGFKNINDGYGHTEGDSALVLVANALKEYCSGMNSFLARYAGDEFCIVHEMMIPGEIERMTHEIMEVVEESGRKADKPYVLRVSIGYACFDGTMSSVKELVDAADRELYKMKEARHKENGV